MFSHGFEVTEWIVFKVLVDLRSKEMLAMPVLPITCSRNSSGDTYNWRFFSVFSPCICWHSSKSLYFRCVINNSCHVVRLDADQKEKGDGF